MRRSTHPGLSGKTSAIAAAPVVIVAPTVHMIVVVRLRYCGRTKTCLQRRTAEGKSKRETMRCLKR